ncbi:MAG TPA: CBS domain-containing protein [Burkholderiaceae bacterium]|nr:CBS domain-containing protein [Burkholderiaceae bacterium]
MTQVHDIMTRGVAVIPAEATLQLAAQRMDELNIGALPVSDGDALVGMITDRDIAVRGVATGMIPQESLVRDVMTSEVHWCNQSDTVEAALAQMGSEQVRRLAVFDVDKRIVGIVSLGDLAIRQNAPTDAALRDISQPGSAL